MPVRAFCSLLQLLLQREQQQQQELLQQQRHHNLSAVRLVDCWLLLGGPGGD